VVVPSGYGIAADLASERIATTITGLAVVEFAAHLGRLAVAVTERHALPLVELAPAADLTDIQASLVW
jgi:hypothetical protein